VSSIDLAYQALPSPRSARLRRMNGNQSVRLPSPFYAQILVSISERSWLRVETAECLPPSSGEAFFQPGGILEALGCVCMSGDVVEFGCGYGTFTVAAASRVSGIVYATDIDPLMIGATITRASQAGLRNVIAEQRDFVSEGCGRPNAEHGRKRPDFSG
jgi:hypothetical protein